MFLANRIPAQRPDPTFAWPQRRWPRRDDLAVFAGSIADQIAARLPCLATGASTLPTCESLTSEFLARSE